MRSDGSIMYHRFKSGKKLDLIKSVLAHCYECNGFESVDCKGVKCALYPFHEFRGGTQVSPDQK